MAARKPLVLNAGKIEQLQSGDTLDGMSGGSSATTPGFIYGLTASNNTSDPTNDIDFGTGYVWVGDRIIQNASTVTKRLDAAWSAGSGNGGLFSGTKLTSSWYHCFALKNDTTHAIDFGFSTSLTASDKPSGWTARLIWSVYSQPASGIIRPFTAIGNWNWWKTPIVDVDLNYYQPLGNYTLSVPQGIATYTQIKQYASASNVNYVYIGDDSADFTVGRIDVQANSIAPLGTFFVLTTTSRAISIKATGSLDKYLVTTSAFLHPRGEW